MGRWQRSATALGLIVVAVATTLATSGPAASAPSLSDDGTVVVQYAGSDEQTADYYPSIPGQLRATLDFHWDEQAVIELEGRRQGTPTEKLVGASLTVSGTITESSANSPSHNCTGTLSTRPGSDSGANAQALAFALDHGSEVTANANLPEFGRYVVSSGPAGTACAVAPNSGVGVAVMPASEATERAQATDPQITLTLPATPYAHTYTASGSDAQYSDALTGQFSVTACGTNSCTTCPTPASDLAAHAPWDVLGRAAAGGTLRVSLRPVGYRINFDGTEVNFNLVGVASGGCPPYSYSWQRGKPPRGSTVTPATAAGQTIMVKALCPRQHRGSKKGPLFVPASCDNEPLKYTVTVRDRKGQSANASIVIEHVFSEHQPFYSPGDPAERKAYMKTLKGASDALAEQCAAGDVVNEILKTGAWEGSYGGLNPLPGPVSTPAAGGAACTEVAVKDVTRRFALAGRALRVAERDPPAADFDSIVVPSELRAATASTCTGSRASLCKQITGDQQAADSELDRALSIAGSIATTTDRHSGAVSAGDQGAAKLQDDAYRAQLAELAQVLALDNQARERLALVLRSNRLNFVFRRSFVNEPVGFLQRAAARLSGSKRSAVEAMLALLRLYKPTIGVSYVGDLLRVIPTAGLVTAGSLAQSEVAALVRQLAAQREIDGPLAGRLIADLNALRLTPAKRRSAALSQLGTDLEAVTGAARPLLQAASGLPIAGASQP